MDNQSKTTMTMKVDQNTADKFENLEKKIKENDNTLTKNDVLEVILREAEKTLSTETGLKIATREELKMIEHHAQRLKDTYLAIFNRAEDHKTISETKIKDLGKELKELKEEHSYKINEYEATLKLVQELKETAYSEKEEALEKVRLVENSLIDKERAIAKLELEIKELEEVRKENRELARENKELLAANSQVKAEITELQNELKYSNDINTRLEKDLENSNNEIKNLYNKIQETISEKDREKAEEIKLINKDHKEDLEALRKELEEKHERKIAELSKINEEKIEKLQKQILELMQKNPDPLT